MPRVHVALLALALFLPDDGSKQGRQGNALYERGEYAAAAAAYQAGLAAVEDAEGAATYGLQHNLGAALHRNGDFEAAAQAFQQALQTAASSVDVGRAAYNAGNNAYAAQDLEASLAAYREALLAQPGDEDAKFNYEYVKRRLDQQQQQQGGEGEDDPEQDPQGEGSEEQREDRSTSSTPDVEGSPDEQNPTPSDEQSEAPPSEGDAEPEETDEPAPSPASPSQENQLSAEQAARILQAIENEEAQLLREVQKMQTRPRRVEKDW